MAIRDIQNYFMLAHFVINTIHDKRQKTFKRNVDLALSIFDSQNIRQKEYPR